MSGWTIALVGVEHFVFEGNPAEAKEYFNKLGIAPNELLPYRSAPAMSNVLMQAMDFVREHGNNPDAFYESLSVEEAVKAQTEGDIREVFDFAVRLNQATGPSDELIRKLAQEYGHTLRLRVKLRSLYPSINPQELSVRIRKCINNEATV